MYKANFRSKLDEFDANARKNSEHSVSSKPAVITESANEITPEPISWLWKEWLARGKLHILAGAAGTGKTTIALNLASTISNGGYFADGSKCSSCKVLIWSGEDDVKDTLLPRLIASGAELTNIHFIRGVAENFEIRSFDPASDVGGLILAAKDIGDIGLMIVDPISNAVTGDSHKNGEVRRGLAPLVEFGQRINCAILGITHFSKGSQNRDPLERVTGSLAFGALARVVMVTAKITDDEITRRIFCKAKSNIGSDEGGFEYTIKQTELQSYPNIFTSFAKLGDALEGTARDLLAESMTLNEGGDCSSFLTELLKNGRMPANEVQKIADESGYTKDQVRRAREKLKIKPHRDGFGQGSKVYWDLPSIKNIKA